MINELFLVTTPGHGESILTRELFDQMDPQPLPNNVVRFVSAEQCMLAENRVRDMLRAEANRAHAELAETKTALANLVNENAKSVAEMEQIIARQKEQIELLQKQAEAQKELSAAVALSLASPARPLQSQQSQQRELWRLEITPWNQPLRAVYFDSKERLDAYCAKLESADTLVRGPDSLHLKIYLKPVRISIESE